MPGADNDADDDAEVATAAIAQAPGADDSFGAGPRRYAVTAALSGSRIDKCLALLLPEVSRSRIQQWIDARAVRLNGVVPRPRDETVEGDVIDIDPPPAPAALAFAPEPMPLAIVYEDDAILVLDKPAGLVVHPAAGNWSGTLLNGLLAYDGSLAQLPRAGIVHRLDADTSGLMVVARTLAAQTDLVRQLQARSVTREYWAVVFGEAPPAGTIDAAIGRDPRNPVKFKVSRAPSAKSARTRFRRIACATLGPSCFSWLACRLETGRTHQIRVHLESIGHPLLGDPLYRRGSPARICVDADSARAAAIARLSRQALHACRLAFDHPVSRRRRTWFRAPPVDLASALRALGFVGVDRLREVFEP